MQFIKFRGNPFEANSTIPKKLHNIATKVAAEPAVVERFLNFHENGEERCTEFRNCRYVHCTVTLSSTISQVKLPKFSGANTYNVDSSSKSKKLTVSPKLVSAAHKTYEIVRSRGFKTAEILKYDFFDTSII